MKNSSKYQIKDDKNSYIDIIGLFESAWIFYITHGLFIDVNFINILLAHFLYKSALCSFL